MTMGNSDNKNSDDMFGKEDLKIAKGLIEFGRIGYVTIRQNVQGKIKLRKSAK